MFPTDVHLAVFIVRHRAVCRVDAHSQVGQRIAHHLQVEEFKYLGNRRLRSEIPGNLILPGSQSLR